MSRFRDGSPGPFPPGTAVNFRRERPRRLRLSVGNDHALPNIFLLGNETTATFFDGRVRRKIIERLAVGEWTVHGPPRSSIRVRPGN